MFLYKMFDIKFEYIEQLIIVLALFNIFYVDGNDRFGNLSLNRDFDPTKLLNELLSDYDPTVRPG